MSPLRGWEHACDRNPGLTSGAKRGRPSGAVTSLQKEPAIHNCKQSVPELPRGGTGVGRWGPGGECAIIPIQGRGSDRKW
jgi:hypothetical protein